jgi:5'-methylthioadenosine phosphorylase
MDKAGRGKGDMGGVPVNPRSEPGADVGIIGGTGVYDPELLEDAKQIEVKTPFGRPSDKVTVGTYEGRKVAIMPRHGSGHSVPPHKINFRANVWAFRELGVGRVFATAAVGSLKEDYRAGDVVIPDQFIDLGKQVHTFYDGPKVVHVSMADPFCPELRELLIRNARGMGIPLKETGTYLRIEGPQFSTRAASHMYRQFAHIIGMTAVPEAILCREQGICFATIATVTDYDVWAEKPVSIEGIKKVMAMNLDSTKRLLAAAVKAVPSERSCACGGALRGAEA